MQYFSFGSIPIVLENLVAKLDISYSYLKMYIYFHYKQNNQKFIFDIFLWKIFLESKYLSLNVTALETFCIQFIEIVDVKLPNNRTIDNMRFLKKELV